MRALPIQTIPLRATRMLKDGIQGAARTEARKRTQHSNTELVPTTDAPDCKQLTPSTTAAFNSQKSAKFLTRPVAVTGYIYF